MCQGASLSVLWLCEVRLFRCSSTKVYDQFTNPGISAGYFGGNVKGSITSEKPKEMHGWKINNSNGEIVQDKSFL